MSSSRHVTPIERRRPHGRAGGDGGGRPIVDTTPAAAADFYAAPVFTLLLGTVLLAPLMLGAVQPWAWGAMAMIIGMLLVAWAWQLARGHRAPVALERIRLPLGCLALAMGWAAIQALPVTPTAWHHPIWGKAAGSLGVELPGAISLNPTETVDAVVRLTTYAAVFYLALNLCREPRRAYRAVQATAFAVTGYAAYGIIAYLRGTDMILWSPKTAYLGDLTGTFVNRNTFATFAGLGLLCAAALVWRGIRHAAPRRLPLHDRCRRVGEYVTTRGLGYVAALFVIGTALILSHSRAGIASTLVGLCVLVGSHVCAGAVSARRAVGIVALIVVLLLGLALPGSPDVLLRVLHSADDATVRLRLFERVLTAIGDAPLLGTGFGSFPDTFRLYRTPDLHAPFLQAHNSYLENVLELGLPAAGLLFVALAAPAAICTAGILRRRRNLTYPCLGLAATTLVGLHALVDFSLQIPAVAAVYALLMGAACAQSWSKNDDTSR